MSLEKCPECRTDVGTTARNCPKCGAKLRISAEARTVIWVVGGIAAFLFLMFLYGNSIPDSERYGHRARELCEKLYQDGQIRSMATCQALQNN